MFEWFLITAPLVFAFGTKPVMKTIVTIYQDEEHGITHAAPALFSVYLVYAAYALILGYSYGWLLISFPAPVFHMVIKYCSVVILFGLAYLIWARDKEIAAENYLSLSEEFVVRAIDPALPLIIIVMYSVFIDITRPLGAQVIAMTIGVVTLSFITHVIWLVASFILDNDFFSAATLVKIDRIMAAVFCLLAALIIML